MLSASKCPVICSSVFTLLESHVQIHMRCSGYNVVVTELEFSALFEGMTN